jgi:hypothetical protein
MKLTIQMQIAGVRPGYQRLQGFLLQVGQPVGNTVVTYVLGTACNPF